MSDAQESERSARARAARRHVERVLGLLAAAINGRMLYPPDHPQVAAAVAALVTGLEELLHERRQEAIGFLLVADDVVVDQLPLRQGAPRLRGFVRALRRLGVDGLHLSRGLDAGECHQFLASLAQGEIPRSTPHFAVGRVQLAVSGDATDGAGAATAANAEAGTPLGAAGGAPLSTAHVEEAREAFVRLRTDPRGGLQVMERLVWEFIDALALGAQALAPLRPLRAHDELTFLHSLNVSLLVLSQARACGYHGELLHDIGLAALLHDIGKLGLPAAVLTKPGPLDEDEWALVRRHPEIGALQLCELDLASPLPILVAYEHHLRYDGQPNYPTLRVPRRPTLASRMTSVADTFDSVTTRHLPRALDAPGALAVLRRRSGTYLDPLLVEGFCAMFGEPPRAPQPS
jgi:HD-GYP domain-containing protein (c-di-GMP phosphodiesterase class II)